MQYLGVRFDPEEFRRDLLSLGKRAIMRLLRALVDLVSRVPARVQAKLLAAFLTIATLLVMVGAVGLQGLREVYQRTEELIKLQRKIEAYRQVQHDTTGQLYGVSSALISSDERTLETTLRQLNQFGYDVDRLEFVAKDEVELLEQFRRDYDRFTAVVTQVVDLIRADRASEAKELQLQQANPLAERLERLTNQLVNKAEADMVAGIEASTRAYDIARWIVVAFAIGRGCPISRSFTTYCVCLELRSLPSTGITRLQRYYKPLRHPKAPGLSLTGFRLVID